MRRILAILVLMTLVSVGSVQAQTATPTSTNTPSPTPTPSPTSTYTPTPELRVMWTLSAPDMEAPGQDVVMTYTFTFDQLITAVLLFAVLVILLVGFTFALLRGWI